MKYKELYHDVGALLRISRAIINETHSQTCGIVFDTMNAGENDILEISDRVRETEIRQRLASDIMDLVWKYMEYFDN